MLAGRQIAPCKIRKAACIEIGFARTRTLQMPLEIDKQFDVDRFISDRADSTLQVSHTVRAPGGEVFG